MYHSFFIHSSVIGHLGCFHVLAIVNNSAMVSAFNCDLSFSIVSQDEWSSYHPVHHFPRGKCPGLDPNANHETNTKEAPSWGSPRPGTGFPIQVPWVKKFKHMNITGLFYLHYISNLWRLHKNYVYLKITFLNPASLPFCCHHSGPAHVLSHAPDSASAPPAPQAVPPQVLETSVRSSQLPVSKQVHSPHHCLAGMCPHWPGSH